MTNERFNELVKEQAVVYWLFRDDILSVDTTLINRKFGDTAIEYFDVTYNCNLTVNISDLYEHREDAQEQKEFDYIPRVEFLKFPKWNEISKTKAGYMVSFFDTNHFTEFLLIVDGHQNFIKVMANEKPLQIFTNITRENYNEARKICIKLFRGDSQ